MIRRRHISSKPVVSLPARATNPVVLFLHSTAKMGDEQWEEAIAALQRFMELVENPLDLHMAYQNLGACYLALERFDEALAALDEAQRTQPGDPEVIYNRAVTYACASRVNEAIAAFELYTRNWPQVAHQRKVKQTLRMLHQIEYAEIPPGSYLLEHLQEQIYHNLEVDDFHLVESKARRMMAAIPERPEGHFALGVACLEQDRYLEALQAFQAAQSRDPNYEPVLYNIGHTYLKLDQPELAISWLERALRREPKNLATLHQLGVACQHLGRRAEAVGWWKGCLEIDPIYGPAQQRLYEIGEGPEPLAPASPNQEKLRRLTPEVKARMRKPQIYRNGSITLTFDGRVGFVLEDADNPLNGTIHAGSPFTTAVILDDDWLDLMGLVKMLLRMIDANNTRDIAILIYYTNGELFNYQARFQQGQRIEFDAQGQFVVAELPLFFKLRIDSDLVTPYGNPMHGMLIYLNQHPQPSFLISTLGLKHAG